MKVSGMVDNPFELTFADLLAMPQVQEAVTLSCVSNEVGGDLVGNAIWQGVPLRTLLDRAGVQSGATQIVGQVGRRLHRRVPDRGARRRSHRAGGRRHERRAAPGRCTGSRPASWSPASTATCRPPSG